MLIYALVYFVLFGAIGWLIGQRKGRPAAGLVWAMLLGPIGWLLVALLPGAEAPAVKSTLPAYREQRKWEG